MSSAFLVKGIDVVVSNATWGRRPVHPALLRSSGYQQIEVCSALHMLGTLTMPNLYSPASPALFWAWLRYYLAAAATDDLRITMDFADLDPHQKGILSDDFGVAIATKWLNDRFGGFREIVDGRRFVLQFPHLLKREFKSKAKVGPNKCPDFVMRDASGKWHILECKGTQVRGYQSSSLKTALQQKNALRLAGAISGERLASALFIANEESEYPTQLKIIDPKDEEPMLTLNADQAKTMDINAQRLSIARALGMIGLSEFATELAFPPSITPTVEFLRPAESRRLRLQTEVRYRRATDQVHELPFITFVSGGIKYRGREVTFGLPSTNGRVPFKTVNVRQGVRASIVENILRLSTTPNKLYEDRIQKPSTIGIVTKSEPRHTTLRFSNIIYSEITSEG